MSGTSPRDYNLIRLNKDTRKFFPGYKVPFTVLFGEDEIMTWIASASAKTPVGALAGNYFSRQVGQIYKVRKDLLDTMVVPFRIVEPGKVYEILDRR